MGPRNHVVDAGEHSPIWEGAILKGKGQALINVCYCDIIRSKIVITRTFSYNQLIQFYSNNVTNLHRLTSHSAPCCPTT